MNVGEAGPAMSHQEREFAHQQALAMGLKDTQQPFIHGYDDDVHDDGDEETVLTRIFHTSH